MDFPFTCTIELPTSENMYHTVSYGTPQTSECYYKTMTESDLDKNIEVKSGWLALPPGTAIKHKSRVTLDNGEQYTASSNIRNVTRLSDNEIEYVRVILGFPLDGRNLS